MWMSSGMTLAGALASGCAMQSPTRMTDTLILLSDSLPATQVFASKAAHLAPVSREIDLALREALINSTTLVSLL